MTRPLPPPSARTLTLLACGVVGVVALAAGSVIGIFVWASNSGAGWLKRHIAASERRSE